MVWGDLMHLAQCQVYLNGVMSTGGVKYWPYWSQIWGLGNPQWPSPSERAH